MAVPLQEVLHARAQPISWVRRHPAGGLALLRSLGSLRAGCRHHPGSTAVQHHERAETFRKRRAEQRADLLAHAMPNQNARPVVPP